MTIADTKRRELDARGTTGSSLFATTALALTLTLGQYTAFHISEKPPSTIRLAGTEGTVTKSYSLEINEIDIFKQIGAPGFSMGIDRALRSGSRSPS